MVPTAGTEGVSGWLFRTAADDATDVHPDELVTVKV